MSKLCFEVKGCQAEKACRLKILSLHIMQALGNAHVNRNNGFSCVYLPTECLNSRREIFALFF